MGWAPRRNRAPIACPCHQKRSAPFRLLPRLFSDALPVRRYLPWRWHWLPAGVMRRSVKNFAEFNVANPSHSVALLDGFALCFKAETTAPLARPGNVCKRKRMRYDSKWSRHIGDGNTENGTWMGVTCLSCFDWLCLSRRDDIGWRTDPSHPMRQSIGFAQSAEICHSMVHLN